MKKKGGLLKSLIICLAVAMLMAGAGFFLLAGESPATQTGGKVEAAWDGQSVKAKYLAENSGEEKTAAEKENHTAAAREQEDASTGDEKDNDDVNEEGASRQAESDSEDGGAVSNGTANLEENNEPEAAVVQTASAAVDHRAKQEENVEPKEESQPVATATEEPAATPAPVEEEKKEEPKPEVQSVAASAPVTYTWGSAGSYTFRMEVSVTNNGSSTSRNVTVALPLLENRSPYQETSLRSVNYNIVSTSGRVSTFNLGDLAPGETKTIRADFDIRVRSMGISSTNETVDKARQAYEMYAGSGNCRTLARAFINKCQEMGINAREVIGFARPQRGAMTSGSLAGTRHSWAEFEVPGVGWVPVDLTFQYFGELPHTSHVVESYSDQSIKVNYSGGSLSATWSNLIL